MFLTNRRKDYITNFILEKTYLSLEPHYVIILGIEYWIAMYLKLSLNIHFCIHFRCFEIISLKYTETSVTKNFH